MTFIFPFHLAGDYLADWLILSVESNTGGLLATSLHRGDPKDQLEVEYSQLSKV